MRTTRLFRSLAVAAAAAILATSVSPAVAPLTAGEAAAEPTVVPTHSSAPPAPADCPQRVGTPPPIDESEVVPAGRPTPTPLPVPEPPMGGDRLAACGVIAEPDAGPTPAGLTSKAWLIADLESGDIIAARDPHGRYRPASTIKVLLALVALEKLDLTEPVVATVNDWSMEGDACGMGPDGTYTVEDMITGLLVVSGNDCANALARMLGGYDQTLEQMNHKAQSLGALDTRAATPSGLDAAGMSTSAYDLAVIFRAAMANDEFARMIALPNYRFPGYPPRKDVPGDEDHPAYLMGTSNTLLRDGVPGMTVLGGKTGYTDDARKTFVGAAEKDGRKLVIVQLDGLGVENDTYHQQAVRMFEYGFAAPASTSIGSLNNRLADRSGAGILAPSGADSLAMGALPLILLAATLLTMAALVVLFLRRRRRYRRR
ncbi:D-alanyl-D-alanine carboxypeptidase [Gordonia hirsuta DSM 44140 = NBRC 16056]|uniref:D-alanyl-D-alanine carboxypeptidase n=1 Tax=Gordonia hirsuta DSM 44140 = NBRC 16056 TaxID=1121927 RepID=L7L6X2_9ACTN|nr:D-alanyl-D-alanine carboxypeptidase family protein [Gordonia hirsuta]GAC56679.1 D-alanyl-D-alanine carboxypeptidase [Gordonia hirsuta DSM 44140 = NBRC 16056]